MDTVNTLRETNPKANGYQRSKARQMAAVILQAAASNPKLTPFGWLPGLTGRMTEAQWRTVAFQAGVAVPDQPAKVLTIAYLLEACQ